MCITKQYSKTNYHKTLHYSFITFSIYLLSIRCIACLSTLGLKSGRVNDMLSILGIMRCESNTKIVPATAVERRPSTNANTITNHETGHQ